MYMKKTMVSVAAYGPYFFFLVGGVEEATLYTAKVLIDTSSCG